MAPLPWCLPRSTMAVVVVVAASVVGTRFCWCGGMSREVCVWIVWVSVSLVWVSRSCLARRWLLGRVCRLLILLLCLCCLCREEECCCCWGSLRMVKPSDTKRGSCRDFRPGEIWEVWLYLLQGLDLRGNIQIILTLSPICSALRNLIIHIFLQRMHSGGSK